jgi:hypothetical protein
MSESLDLCSTCKAGYVKPTGEVLVEGESVGESKDIGGRRVYVCENCRQIQIRIGVREYIAIGDEVKTETEKR